MKDLVRITKTIAKMQAIEQELNQAKHAKKISS